MPHLDSKLAHSYRTYSDVTSGKVSSKGNGYLTSKTHSSSSNNHKVSHNASTNTVALPQLQSVGRIAAIPIVETGIGLGEKLYSRIKESNALTKWSLSTAEATLLVSVQLALPAVSYFSAPLLLVDSVLCRSLDIVKQRVPAVYLPTETLYHNAQELVESVVVRPVLRRADSVKQLGTAVLESRVSVYAAQSLDSALDKADSYVDKYLPDDSQDTTDGCEDKAASPETNGASTGSCLRALQTMQHADRFSRKLQRRLTRRTLMEAKALKEHTTEAIHVLIYVAELVATDPKLALQKAGELWASLSQDEPENQERPATLEQLLVMLTRESSRRLVHLINYTTSGVSKFPKSMVNSLRDASAKLTVVADSLIKRVHLDGAKQLVLHEAKVMKVRLQILLEELQQHSKELLVQLAMLIAGNTEREKIRSRCHIRNNHLYSANNTAINGVN